MFYDYLAKYKSYDFTKRLKYEDNKLVKKWIFDQSRFITNIYDENNTLIKSYNVEGSIYDTCIPFQSYRVKEDK